MYPNNTASISGTATYSVALAFFATDEERHHLIGLTEARGPKGFKKVIPQSWRDKALTWAANEGLIVPVSPSQDAATGTSSPPIISTPPPTLEGPSEAPARAPESGAAPSQSASTAPPASPSLRRVPVRLQAKPAARDTATAAKPQAPANMKIDKLSLDLLNRISDDFLLLANSGQMVAYHIDSGDKLGKEGFEAFSHRHYGDCEVINAKGESERVISGKLWWGSDLEGKRIVRRIVMEPTRLPEYEDPCGPQVFNRWHLLKLTMTEPNLEAVPSDCEILLNHLMYISDGDAEGVTYFLNWLAQLYQFPEVKIPSAIMLYSKYGRLGKSVLSKLLTRVFGQPLCAAATGASLQKQFNSIIDGKRLLFLNEMANTGSRGDRLAAYERFKNMISEEEIAVEAKGVDERSVRNFCHFIITTNNLDALPLMEEDGRILVLRCEARRQDDAYYQKLVPWLEGPGPSMVAGMLANWKFPVGWDPHAPVPQTAAVRAAQVAVRSPLAQWLEELVTAAASPFDRDLLKTGSVIEQLGTLYPYQSRQHQLNTTAIGKALRSLDYVEIKSGTADRYLCRAERADYWSTKGPTAWKAYYEARRGGEPDDYPVAWKASPAADGLGEKHIDNAQPTRH